ncbi:AMIN-like domain-containing (lipo)protein [Candidatus Frankia meridionalis]|uniref:AMIN-like domain-containing (lipo)protein n=1 Tax=Candidatus Protofrankia californiensis TaxID=1839754 RepID=UPI0010415566
MKISTSHAASARTDLVTFRFRGAAPTCTAAYVPRSELIADPSGQRLFVPGRSFVKVTCHPATAHNEQGQPTAPGNLFSLRTTNIIKIKLGGDFEAVLTYFVGLRQRQPAPPVHPTVNTQGNTVVVGIPTR